MSVNYTKVFTVIGSVVDKVIDYNTYIATYTTDQAAIEAILAAQSLVRLETDLVNVYDTFRQGISSDINKLISRVTTTLTDDTLIGQNFAFGQSPDLGIVWPALITDMLANDHNIKANVPTVGSATFVTKNTLHGALETGLLLDGITSPIDGAPSIPAYSGLTSQLTPTSETLTFTCIADSETQTVRGSEVFQITGTGAGSAGYSPTGENAGNLGTITVVDNLVNQFASNTSFDSWSPGGPDGWDVTAGVADTDFEEGNITVTGSGSSFKTIQSSTAYSLQQNLNPGSFQRKKTYWLSAWAAKVTDSTGDGSILLGITDEGTLSKVLTIQPTGDTEWQHFATQFIIPDEISGNLKITFTTSTSTGSTDPIYLDDVIIAPCEYHEGVAFSIYGGPDKFIIGDTITLTISNSDAGKFQTFFRRAYGIQLPTDASPTISDSLVT